MTDEHGDIRSCQIISGATYIKTTPYDDFAPYLVTAAFTHHVSQASSHAVTLFLVTTEIEREREGGDTDEKTSTLSTRDVKTERRAAENRYANRTSRLKSSRLDNS